MMKICNFPIWAKKLKKKKKIIHHTILLSPLNGSVDSLLNITIALKNIQHIKLIKTETQLYFTSLNVVSSRRFEPRNSHTSITFFVIIWFSEKVPFLKYSGFFVWLTVCLKLRWQTDQWTFNEAYAFDWNLCTSVMHGKWSRQVLNLQFIKVWPWRFSEDTALSFMKHSQRQAVYNNCGFLSMKH